MKKVLLIEEGEDLKKYMKEVLKDEEVRNYAKQVIEGQVKSIIRGNFDEIIKLEFERKIKATNESNFLRIFKDAVDAFIKKNFMPEYRDINAMVKEAVKQQVDEYLEKEMKHRLNLNGLINQMAIDKLKEIIAQQETIAKQNSGQ